jgi:beta-phosphoglucomutase-like phosphatase (HAD superfamily)
MSARKMKGIVFDFNGTLFADDRFHEKAWRATAARIRGGELTEKDWKAILGSNNRRTLEYLKGSAMTDEEVEWWSNEKEVLYRQNCVDEPDALKLAPGAPDLLDFLLEKGVPCAIASMAGKDNMDFYIEKFQLGKWFDSNSIVYDTGDLPSKPDPAIYVKAIERLKVAPGECVAVEDSVSGATAAIRAGMGLVYGVGDGKKREGLSSVAGLAGHIHDFTEFDRTIFA